MESEPVYTITSAEVVYAAQLCEPNGGLQDISISDKWDDSQRHKRAENIFHNTRAHCINDAKFNWTYSYNIESNTYKIKNGLLQGRF